MFILFISKLYAMKKQKLWDSWEIEYLINYYTTTDMVNIMNTLGRSMSSITNKAFQLKLPNRTNKLSDLSPLLLETFEAYYWMGFLMADGHFSKNGQIQINLSNKDLYHLKKLSIFVKYKGTLTTPKLYIGDCKSFPLIIKKFNISNNKTYNPPKLNIVNPDLLFSFIIGFIDGDGSIDKYGYLRIKIHKNWYDTLELMMSTLAKNSNYNMNIDSRNLVTGSITKIEIMKRIKTKILDLKLPVLERKWDRVNFNYLSRKEKRQALDTQCFDLFKKGYLPKGVVNLTNISSTFIYGSFKRWKSLKQKDIERELQRESKIK